MSIILFYILDFETTVDKRACQDLNPAISNNPVPATKL